MMVMLRPFLQPAIDRTLGELTIADVYAVVSKHAAQVWLVYDEEKERVIGVAVTEITQYPGLKALRVFLLGGKRMAEWKDLLDEHFGDFCELEGITRIEVVGRKGFLVALADMGYNLAYTVLTKEIVHHG